MDKGRLMLISQQPNGKYQIYLNTNWNTIFDVPEEVIISFVQQIWDKAEPKNGSYVKHYTNKEDDKNV
jgi:hypothetical protein